MANGRGCRKIAAPQSTAVALSEVEDGRAMPIGGSAAIGRRGSHFDTVYLTWPALVLEKLMRQPDRALHVLDLLQRLIRGKLFIAKFC